jgi:hypothetical protein
VRSVDGVFDLGHELVSFPASLLELVRVLVIYGLLYVGTASTARLRTVSAVNS